MDGITREELMRVVNVWADTALNLSDRDLRMMERLIRAQHRTSNNATPERSGNVVPMQPGIALELA